MKNLILFVLSSLALTTSAFAGYLEVGALPNINPQRTACTVTASASTGMTFKNVFCWEIGDTLNIEGEAVFTSATGAGSIWRLNIPSGYTINTAKLPNGTVDSAGEASSCGYSTLWDDASSGYRPIHPVLYNTGGTQNQIKFIYGGQDMLDNDMANNDSLNFKIAVPVR